MSIDFAGLRASNPIADVVGRYVELRRSGSEYQARCPFHADRNPSFYVVPKKGKAFCMGCGWHGDVIDFVAEIEHCDTAEAARKLGHQELPRDRPPPAPLPPDLSEDWVPVVPVPRDAPMPWIDGGDWRVWNPKRDRWWRFRPVASWAYKAPAKRGEHHDLLGWVARIQFDDGAKVTPTVTYCRHQETGELRWCSRPFPSPRPLLRLEELAARPDAGVLLVSGEKCAAAAARLLPGFVAVTWPGGDRGVAHVDWTPLYGRAVTAWPDLDRQNDRTGARLPYDEQSGVASMRAVLELLHPHGGALRELGLEAEFDGTDFPDGWDIADAAEILNTSEIVTFCKARVRPWVPREKEKAGPSVGGGNATATTGDEGHPGFSASDGPAGFEYAPGDAVNATDEAPGAEMSEEEWQQYLADLDHAAGGDGSLPPTEGEVVDLPASRQQPPPGDAYAARIRWSDLDLVLNENGSPVPNLDNAARVLERHPDLLGRFWYDEFLQRILTTWNQRGEVREWGDADDVRLALWLQRVMGIGRMAVGTARDAVTAVAMAHRRNELQDWLRALRWDGEPRMHLLFPLGFGAEATTYTEAVGRCFLIGMVARALSPGCKVDNMPVLEGPQGKGKSTALQVLAGERWYAVSGESVLAKDFYTTLQGKWLVEIAEMDTFGRAEIGAVKRIMSTQTDRFRAPYGRRAEDHPRSSVFGGTVNEDEYLRDATGARRFWPVRCGALGLTWIERQREQLFAEAVVAYQARTPWWDVPLADAQREQEQRRVADAWEVVIGQWLVGKQDVTVGEVLDGALGLKAESWDRPSQMRVATTLRVLGWVNGGNARRKGQVVKVWHNPQGGYGSNNELL